MISPGVAELTVDIKIQKSSGKVPQLKTVGSLRARKNRCLHTHTHHARDHYTHAIFRKKNPIKIMSRALATRDV